MAKGTAAKNGPSKVRLIVFEAEIMDGDLSQVTHVLQNAFRSTQTTPKVVQISPAATGALSNSHADDDIIDGEEAGESVDVASTAPKPRSQRKPKIARTPTVVNDVDFTSPTGLKEFVDQFEIKTNVDRYLAIALWFRDTRQMETVNVDQVYTAFKMLGWSTNMSDFEKTFRNLRDQQAFQGGSKEGYKLTLPGAAKIEQKKK